LACEGDIAEGIHHAPDRAEESEEGGTADGGGEEDEVGFEFERFFADGTFHGGADGVHPRLADGPGGGEAGGEGGIDGGGSGEMEAEFFGAGVVDDGLRRFPWGPAREVRIEGFGRGAKAFEEGEGGTLSGAELGEFGPHDRPAENGSDHEKENDALTCGVGVFEGEEDSRGSEHDMAITDGRMETRAEGGGNFEIRIADRR